MSTKNISELIEYLELIKKMHGDMPVYGAFRENIEDFSELVSIYGLCEDEIYIEIS